MTTDFDKKLFEKASQFRIWDYADIRVLARIADTSEGCDDLVRLSDQYYDLAHETL